MEAFSLSPTAVDAQAAPADDLDVMQGDFAAGLRQAPPSDSGPDFAAGMRACERHACVGHFARGQSHPRSYLGRGDFAAVLSKQLRVIPARCAR